MNGGGGVVVHHLLGPKKSSPMVVPDARGESVGDIKKYVEETAGIPACRIVLLNDRDQVMGDDFLTQNQEKSIQELHMKINLQGGCASECCGCTWYGPFCVRDCNGYDVCGCSIQ